MTFEAPSPSNAGSRKHRMNCVSLVGTVHDELGRANASELCAILERIRPEVIFLEVPLAAFDDYYVMCRRSNLESIAVRRYRESHHVKLVPVDRPTPGSEFFENTEYLRKRIWEDSPGYRQLIALDSACISARGFAYLNSESCGNLWADVYKEMLSTIRRIGDSRLVEIFNSWKETIDLREEEMTKKIQEYLGANTVDRGAFLVGAAHRQLIIDKSRKKSRVDSNSMQWDFSVR